MPGGDRRGPDGRGPMSGRGLGYCAGYNSPGFTKGMPMGRGLGHGYWGHGRGYGWRNHSYSTPYYEPVSYHRNVYSEPNREDEKRYLEDMAKGLEEELKSIKERLQDLSKQKKEKD